MNIYIHKDGTQYGPYSLEQVQQYIQQGAFTLQDQACHDGQNWVPLSQVPGIAQQAQPQAQAAPQQRQQATNPQAGGNANAKFNQTTTASAKSGKNKIIIFGAAGAVILIALVTTLIVPLSGDDEDG